MAELRLRATEKLAETRLDVSDEKVRVFFESHPEQFNHAVSPTNAPPFESNKTQALAQYLDSLYNQLIADRVKSATVKSDSSALDALVQ